MLSKHLQGHCPVTCPLPCHAATDESVLVRVGWLGRTARHGGPRSELRYVVTETNYLD